MSTSGNEFDEPGVNYPDRRDAEDANDTTTSTGEADTRSTDAPSPMGETPDGHHYGHDGGRDTMTVDQAQRSGALDERGEQSRPAMSENNASASEKLDGLVEQMRADLAGEPIATVEHAVRGRVAQAGLDVSDADIAALSRRIASDTEV